MENSSVLLKKVITPLKNDEINNVIIKSFMDIKNFMKSRGMIDDAINDMRIIGKSTDNKKFGVRAYESKQPFTWTLRYTVGPPKFLAGPSPISEYDHLKGYTEKGNN